MTTVKQQSPSGLHLKNNNPLLIHSLTLPLTTHSKRTKGQHWSLSGLQFKIKPHTFFLVLFTPMIHSNATTAETFQSTLQNYLQRPTSHPVPSAIHLPSCPVSIPPPLLSRQHPTSPPVPSASHLPSCPVSIPSPLLSRQHPTSPPVPSAFH